MRCSKNTYEDFYTEVGTTRVSATDGDRDIASAQLTEEAREAALDYALVSSVTVVQEIVRKLCRQEIGFGMDNSYKLHPSRVKARWVFDSLLEPCICRCTGS
jgi:hypothetical protein